MKLFGNLFTPTGTLPRQREAVPGIPSTTDPNAPENQTRIRSGSYEVNIKRPSSPQAALTISAVYRAVELRAKTEAQFQPQFQKMNYAGGNFVPDYRGVGRRYNYLLSVQPNPTMSAAQFWKQIVIQKLLLGNAVVYIERDEFGLPLYFWLTRSASYNIATGTYTVTYTSERGVVALTNLPRTEVLHFMNTFTTPDGLWGYSTLRYACDTLSLVKTESHQALDSAAKGGRVKLLIGEDRTSNQGLLSGGLFTQDQGKQFAKEINNEIYAQDVVSLRGLDKAQSISMSAQEMQMVEMLGMGMDDVARFFGTPRPLLMLDTNSHYTTYVNARMEFFTNTVQADIEEHEQELQRKLIREKDFMVYRWHLCEQPVMRLDKEAQAKVDEINLRTGATTVNEIRQQYDRPAVENGNEPLASANLMTLKALMAKEQGATTAPAEPANEQNEEKGGQS